jgi:putative ABC transport system permease protein
MNTLLQDFRYALRQLRKSPGFTLTAVITLTLGIGANVAMFTVVRSVLLKPLPFKEPERLVAIYENSGGEFEYNVVAGGVFAEWRRQNRSFFDLALYNNSEFNLSVAGGQLPEVAHGSACTWNLMSTLGVQPALGRNFTADEDQPSANRTVLLSWGLWKRRFGGNPAIVNQTVYLNSLPYTVVGVMPEWLAYPNAQTQLWTPIYRYMPARRMEQIDSHSYSVIGRLNPGVTVEQGRADLSLIVRRLHDQHLDNPFVSKSANIRPLLDSLVGDVKTSLYVLFAATGCVLLIACLNISNLLVARAATRRKEMAIRTALGCGWLRLLREQLMESLLLSSLGGGLGMLMAYGAVQWLVSTRQNMSRAESIHIDGAVAAFTVALIVLSAIFASLIASRSAKDKQIFSALQETPRNSSAGHGRARLRKTLLVVEVGLTVVLLIMAGLLLKSYARLRSSQMGCATENVLTMRLDLFGARYREPAQVVNFYAALLARVRALPGVQAAGFVEAVPGQGYWEDNGFSVVEHPPLPQGKGQFAIFRTADPGYFAAMGIPMLRGDTFDANRQLDQANQTVISDSFAKQYFPNEDPIGKHLRTGMGGKVYEIAGIVGDTRYTPAEDPKPMQYYPLAAGFTNNGTLVIRANRNVEQLAMPVQHAIAEIDHDLPVSDVLTMDQLLDKSTIDESFNATLFLTFASLSLLLAGVGLFGVLSYIVSQRTSEIAIRFALGAQRERVLAQVIFDGLRPALVGLAFGLVASVAATRLVASMLYGTRPLDPAVYALVTGLLLIFTILACALPAWRASRLDPILALRSE